MHDTAWLFKCQPTSVCYFISDNESAVFVLRTHTARSIRPTSSTKM